MTEQAFSSGKSEETAVPAGRAAISKGLLWAGRILSGLAVLFLVMDGGMKLLNHLTSWKRPYIWAIPSLRSSA
jgi:hypothetical protein